MKGEEPRTSVCGVKVHWFTEIAFRTCPHDQECTCPFGKVPQAGTCFA